MSMVEFDILGATDPAYIEWLEDGHLSSSPMPVRRAEDPRVGRMTMSAMLDCAAERGAWSPIGPRYFKRRAQQQFSEAAE